jgi:hypothetical protein
MRAYLRRWKAEIGTLFEGTGPDPTDDQIRTIASRHPAFAHFLSSSSQRPITMSALSAAQ